MHLIRETADQPANAETAVPNQVVWKDSQSYGHPGVTALLSVSLSVLGRQRQGLVGRGGLCSTGHGRGVVVLGCRKRDENGWSDGHKRAENGWL
jgi:hypothetical protein